MVDNSRWAASVVYGSSYNLEAGFAGTELSPGLHRLEFYSGVMTAIIGVDIDSPPAQTSSRASWLVTPPPLALASTGRFFLAIGCNRYFGGLHSRTYNAAANILLNNFALDRVNLRVKPGTHSDYFHHMPLPDRFPEVAPFSECRTVYAWPIPPNRLDPRLTRHVVTIELDANVAWDVDYVGFVYEAPHRIFISYSRKDSQVATALRKRLSKLGIPIWIDTQEIKIGDSLIRKIESAIEGVEYVFALISDNSIRSSWVQKELEVALTREINGRLTVVVPILLDDCEVPGFLKPKAYADLRKPRNFSRVMRQIEQLLAR